MTGIFIYEENIAFDGSTESWPVFRIELTGIIIQHGLLWLFSTVSCVCVFFGLRTVQFDQIMRLWSSNLGQGSLQS